LDFALSRNERGKSQQVLYAEVRSARRECLEWVGRARAGPSRWKTPQATGIIVKVHPLLSPRTAALHQHEFAPAQRMKGMGNPHQLRCIDRIACS
jgi:hypothetical protein